MRRPTSFDAGGIAGLRQLAAFIVLALVIPTLAGAAFVPAELRTSAVAPAPAWDPTDGELVRILATVAGHDVGAALPIVDVPADVTLPGMLLYLSARGGQMLAPEDLEPFLALDPRVQAPLLLMLVTIDRAWDMRDASFAQLDAAELRELHALSTAHATDTPRYDALAAQLDPEPLVEAAILLLDTLEGIVVPALMDAFEAGVWPTIAVADPVGFVRLGSGGNDFEDVDRMFQFDPAGDDVYWNNAGGTGLGRDIDPTTLDYSIALSADGLGDDDYIELQPHRALGSAFAGIGIMLDFEGNDYYRCRDPCLGNGGNGVGFGRDLLGDDTFASGSGGAGVGVGEGSIGVLRDDSGDDSYRVDALGGAYADREGSLGLLWDRAGYDVREAWNVVLWMYGWGRAGGRAWFVDEGAEIDSYVASWNCNTCTWATGTSSPLTGRVNGRGIDGIGSISTLIVSELSAA